MLIMNIKLAFFLIFTVRNFDLKFAKNTSPHENDLIKLFVLFFFALQGPMIVQICAKNPFNHLEFVKSKI